MTLRGQSFVLFVLYVCQVADPSLPSNLKSLLLNGMALGDKHAKLSFSGWPWAPDARKRDILEVPAAPRHGEIPLFVNPGLMA